MTRLRSKGTGLVVRVDDEYATQLLRSGSYQPLGEAAAEPQTGDLECPICGKQLKSKAGLNSHVRSHQQQEE